MVASCYRRMNSYQQAYKMYEEIIQDHPDNIECLRYLVTICKELGYKYDHYSLQLKKLERMQDLHNHQLGYHQQAPNEYEYNPTMSYAQQPTQSDYQAQ